MFRRTSHLAAQPMSGTVCSAPAALVSSSGEKTHERVIAPASAEAVHRMINDAVAGKMPASPDTLEVKTSVAQAAANQTARVLAASSSHGTRQFAMWMTTSSSMAMKDCAKH